MTSIAVLGGTGYTGSHIVAEAARRGHTVRSFSRTVPAEQLEGVEYLTGSALDSSAVRQAVEGVQVIVASLAPRGPLEDALTGIYTELAEVAAASRSRLVVIGGFSSLRPAAGAGRIAFGPDVPSPFAVEAQTMARFVDQLLDSAPAGLDWVFVSPSAGYGSYAPGPTVGSYRVGGDTVDGARPELSAGDFALAVVDEIESAAHRNQHISISY